MEKTSPIHGIVELTEIPKNDVLDYWNEFAQNGETENVLWELSDMDIDTYYRKQKADERNKRYGFYMNGRLCGMLRISSRINYEANGMIGYSIRPHERGNGYAKRMIRDAVRHCTWKGILPVTACVDVKNETSIHVLKRCGFKETGRVFEWTPNPEPRTAIELCHN